MVSSAANCSTVYKHLFVAQSCAGTRKARAGHYLTNNIPARRIFGSCVILFHPCWASLNILAGGKYNLLCILVTFLTLFSPFYLPLCREDVNFATKKTQTSIYVFVPGALGLEGLEFLEFHQTFKLLCILHL